MKLLLNLLLLALALPALLSCGYVLLLTLLSAGLPKPVPRARSLRFDVIVPAHNESANIKPTIASLLKFDWPSDAFRVICVADNCTDDTATIAAAAGARVLERHDTTLRGKGYALLHAFEASRAENWADAVVVIDADSEGSPNMLAAFAARIEAGAHAIQAHYGVRNALDSWRTRLITIAIGAFHIVRSRARERLGLSCGLRGNGWCVTHQVLAAVPYQAFSLVEDVEYGVTLGMAGYRVHYTDEAHANADMVSGGEIARKQRQRWEIGRFALIRSATLPLLRAAIRQPSAICLDLALDLMVLPLSYVALNVLVLAAVAIPAAWFGLAWSGWLWILAGCFGALVLYVLRGWRLSGVGARGALDLAACAQGMGANDSRNEVRQVVTLET
jgi:1,2-diacylglycerol 3-beta-glucosyltransferase